MIRSLSSDLRSAVKTMSRRPGVTMLILLTMAVGIGAATAVFSVVESVLLRPLPYPEVDRLVIPRTKDHGRPLTYNTTYPELLQWRDEEVFESVATIARYGADLTGVGDPVRVSVIEVGDQYFGTVRMDAVLGRVFADSEHEPEGPGVVVLGEHFWQTRFGADPEVLGRTIRIDDVACSIIGVAPWQASSPVAADVWLPARPVTTNPDLLDWDNHAYTAIARLKQGESPGSTAARLATLAARAEAEHPQLRAGETIVAISLTRFYTGTRAGRVLLILLGAVCFVLLMGCVNIANLLLSVASRRRQELAVRSALGAGRSRLTAQLLVESLLLAPIGGALGILVSVLLVKALVAIAPVAMPRIDQVEINLAVLAFAIGGSFLVTLVFAAMPAIRASSVSVTVLRGGPSTTIGKGERRSRNLLIGLQLALSLSLLAGAGYTILGLGNLRSSELGFDTANLVKIPISLPRARYQPGAPVIGFYERLVQEISAQPGVESATLRSAEPIGGGGFYLFRSFLAEGQLEPPAGVETSGPWTVVGENHFRTMGIPLLRGRELQATDNADSQPVMVVNRHFAKQMFGEEDPLGKRVRSWRDENIYREIVGVVGNERYFSVGDQIRPCVYVPHWQDQWRDMSLFVRLDPRPAAVIPQLRATISRLDPDLVVAEVVGMDQVFAQNLAGARFMTILLVIFAALALLQVGLGIFGVLSYLTSLRTREIGIRFALGASKKDVVGMVIRDNLRVMAYGMLAGLVGVLVTGLMLRRLLFEVSAVEPLLVLVVCLILAAVALLASLVPANRAAAINPVNALRLE